ncbi:hypothetical protein GOP47_0004963 [Adiantum capillus-veneris]|uniref:Uncharacterized protein n=1 Tax=Adiantum capillus-veneris TaxID=13818 RepID=A0A9D4V4A0_ADICA|nr:hypothetical protein GOP47_0004963 [Adiantum capillus-veneris]
MAAARIKMSSIAALICLGTAMVALNIAGAMGLLADGGQQSTAQRKGMGFSVREEGCPVEEYAYPFQSVCNEPAQFDVEYHLVAPYSNALVATGGLTVSNWSGQRVSFTGNASDEGYKFTLTALSASAGENITLGTAFTITNSETQLKLGWQFSAWHRGVILSLVENSSMATEFHLVQACNVPLPCPETTGARCESYFLLSTGLVGLTVVGSATDIWPQWIVPADAGSSGNIPLLLRRVYTSVNIHPIVDP